MCFEAAEVAGRPETLRVPHSAVTYPDVEIDAYPNGKVWLTDTSDGEMVSVDANILEQALALTRKVTERKRSA